MLAHEPGASIGAIAAKAGVDRSTVYRRFKSRDELMLAVHRAKFDASEDVINLARLQSAPIAVALHRWVEGIVEVSRSWPVDAEELKSNQEAQARATDQIARIRAFIGRARASGAISTNYSVEWAADCLIRLTDLAAHEYEQLSAAEAADLVVATLLDGLGARSPGR
jgi:AcrR family transcriptional regulator